MYKIDKQTLIATLQYLLSRPMSEVEGLVNTLRGLEDIWLGKIKEQLEKDLKTNEK